MNRQRDDRPPPHDPAAERAVLGACLVPEDETAVVIAVDRLSPEDFYASPHQFIFAAITELATRRSAIDIVTVESELERRGKLDAVGGTAAVSDLSAAFPTVANAEHYIRIVERLAAARATLVSLFRGGEAIRRGEDVRAVLLRTRMQIEKELSRVEDAPKAAVQVRPYSEIEQEDVDWLWYPWIAAGMLTLLEGDPGLGKTTQAIDIAARVSTGSPMPSGGVPGRPAGVLYVSAEDSPSATIRPRLEAAGADLSRVYEGTLRLGDEERLPTIPDDIPKIERLVREHGVRLVVYDPFMALLSPEVNSHRDQDVRRALAPLAAMAARTGAAIVIIRHLNKAKGVSAIYRGGGSIGIAGAARSILLVATDPENEDMRVLAHVKSNLSRRAKSVTFRLVEKSAGISVIEWGGESPHTADDLVMVTPDSGEERTARDEAVDFLQGLLCNGPIPADEVTRAAKRAGISDRTLTRAKAALTVESKREGGLGSAGKWTWQLPNIATRGGVAPLRLVPLSEGDSKDVEPMVSGHSAKDANGDGVLKDASPSGTLKDDAADRRGERCRGCGFERFLCECAGPASEEPPVPLLPFTEPGARTDSPLGGRP